MFQHTDQVVQRFRIGVEEIVVFCSLPAHPKQAGVLQDLNVMGNGRPGKMGPCGDRADPGAAAVFHLHHFQNQVLAVFVPQRQQNLPAGFEFVCQAPDLFVL